MFDLGVVDLWCIQSANFRGYDLCIWTQLWSYGLFCLGLMQRVGLIFALFCHLSFPTLIFIHGAPSERRTARCMCPLCYFACCQAGNEPWQADSWLPHCPSWSAVVCCPVSHCHCGSQCGHGQDILDWNSSISVSNQTNSTLKVNKNPERNTDNIRAADSLFVGRPRWKYMWRERFFYTFGSCHDFDLPLGMLRWIRPQKWTQYILLNSNNH